MKPLALTLAALLGIAAALLGARWAGLTGSGGGPAPLAPGPEAGTPVDVSSPGGGTPGSDRTDARQAVVPQTVVPREITPEERERILRAVEEERERREVERAAERVQRQEEEFRRRAELVANRLGLPAGSGEKIRALFSDERERVAEIREKFRATPATSTSREEMRRKVMDARRWRDEQLTLLFGPEVAKDIAKFEDDVMGEENLIDKGWKPDQPRW